jgi:hypothetical protein
MASGVGFFVGLAVSLVFFLGSLIPAIFNSRWGAVGYVVAIDIAFAVMAVFKLEHHGPKERGVVPTRTA